MNAVTKQHSWTRLLKLYSDQYKGMPTRLGLFEPANGAVNDYWLEDGLPLISVGVNADGEMPSVEFELAGYHHTVSGVTKLDVHFCANGADDGIDVTDSLGQTTVLRFES